RPIPPIRRLRIPSLQNRPKLWTISKELISRAYAHGELGYAEAEESLRYLAPNTPFSGEQEALTGEAIPTFGKIGGTYAWISIAVTVGDIGYQLAEAFGADMDNGMARAWAEFSYYFNKYATPQGWITMAVEPIMKQTHMLDMTLEQKSHLLKKFQLNCY